MNPINYLIDTIFIPFLQFSYSTIIPNYGVAIILLTLFIRAIFYPLTRKQFESLKATQKIQPKVKKLQEKYKKEPEKMQAEMMKLWKENNANPLGGCLPALVQLPFFFAIFYTIKSDTFTQLLTQPGINPGLFPFWLSNLSQPDGTYILPILIGVLTYASQKLTTVDQKQMAMLVFMPVVMVVICINMPAGVLIYWATSQFVSTAQQYFIMQKTS
jgi:YidC/Oxa1 family membrane protein insertase